MTKKLVCMTLAMAVAGALAQKAFADNEKGTATIKGKVVYDGTPAKPKPLPSMGAVPECHKQNPSPPADQSTIVYTKAGNTIPYAFVYIKSGIKGKYDPPSEPLVVDQKGCMYKPHVMGMIAGQPIHIKNSDPTNHNIHSLPTKNSGFNFAQAQQGMTKDLKGNDTFTKPEIMVKVKCDVHSWMSSFIGVVAHPFFSVTKSHDDNGASESDRGTFEIKNVPAGDYEVEAWHETFGTVTQKVSVKVGETKEIEFKMKK